MSNLDGAAIKAIADLAEKAASVEVIDLEGGRKLALIPSGLTPKDISDEHGLALSAPRYIKQAVRIETADSLVDYVKAFSSNATLLFADIAANRIIASLDYHARDEASVCAHSAKLELKYSEEWSLWTKISGNLMPQLEFARFLEENAADIVAPTAGELLDACRDLQVHRKVNFIKAVRTASDNENFEFTHDVQASSKRGELELPTKFQLSIPVYFGSPATDLFAFLRWKLDEDNGGLTLGIKLHRVEHVRQAVFKQIVMDVAERAEQPAVFGARE